jgi:hypothetical protein
VQEIADDHRWLRGCCTSATGIDRRLVNPNAAEQSFHEYDGAQHLSYMYVF